MTIKVLLAADKTNPVEVQNWLDENFSVTVISMVVSDNIFYILYK